MPLRVLDEIEFWKRQEAEHTVVLREAIPNLEEEFVTQLADWELIFTETESVAVKYIEAVIRCGRSVGPTLIDQIVELAKVALDESERFIDLLNRIRSTSEAVQSNQTAGVIVCHIRRESQYLSGIIEAFLECN